MEELCIRMRIACETATRTQSSYNQMCVDVQSVDDVFVGNSNTFQRLTVYEWFRRFGYTEYIVSTEWINESWGMMEFCLRTIFPL